MNWVIENESDSNNTSTINDKSLLEELKGIMEKKSLYNDGANEESEEYEDDYTDKEDYSDEEDDYYDEEDEERYIEEDDDDEEEDYEEDLEISDNDEDDGGSNDLAASPMNISSSTSTPEVSLSLSPSKEEYKEKREMFDNPRPIVDIHEPAYLEYEWVFYYDDSTLKGQSCDDYQSFVKNLGSFNTIQGFWGFWNNIINSAMFPDGTNLRLFKQGIAPMWEDPCNENGGKWTLSCHKDHSHNLALKTILALIGEQLDYSHDICGFVLSVRSNRHVISVWNKSGDDKEIHEKICDQLKDSVFGRVFKYFPHKQLEKSNGSVPPSPMTPSHSSYNLRSSSSSGYITPIKRENSSPMISKLVNSPSYNSDLQKSLENISSNGNNNCNNSNNNLISSFENVNNNNNNNNNRKDSFKFKKSQSTSSLNIGIKSSSSSLTNSSNNSNVYTPLKSSREVPINNSTPKLNNSLSRENLKSNLTSVEISTLSPKIDDVNNINNNIVTNNIVQTEDQKISTPTTILTKSNSKEDIKSSNGYKKHQNYTAQQNNTPQKRFTKNEIKDKAMPTSSKPPLAPAHNNSFNNNSSSNVCCNTPSKIVNEVLNNIAAASTSGTKDKDQIEEIILAAASASGLIVVDPTTISPTSSAVSTSPPSPLLDSLSNTPTLSNKFALTPSKEEIEKSISVDYDKKQIQHISQDESISEADVSSFIEVDNSSDLQTDVSSNIVPKSKKKKSKSKSKNNSNVKLANTTTSSRKKVNSSRNNQNNITLNDQFLVQSGKTSSTLSSTIGFLKDHKIVFIMIFSILFIPVILQTK
ncbi:hypothetical protein DICPUDRAFT_99410 [Dictyostelium purpureum]|uniref:Uncharacterized protein n=1 Tax=Dictyostelium purpureum TaxID=5786 RepID=F0ZZ02_DICPU|nr:uncharacterized protein DICPUDRAFT_99410 [Dictyostelium purpureum]EGC30825.1 hypothetical protein DICPUDRAFT_99410 [Dictyostelium purpureum]|eukprot:XP_003292639.1 hypothetical protein DICPUDRAFT_99410 [Dictyostelium purpureum]